MEPSFCQSSWEGQLVPEQPYNPERQDGWRQDDERVLDHLSRAIGLNIGLHDGPPDYMNNTHLMKLCASR